MEMLKGRIARSLVTIIFLSLINVISGPILLSNVAINRAEAANSNLIQTGLSLDANATTGANDVTSSMTFGSVQPTYTNSGVGYYTFDGTLNKYAYAHQDFADKANVSIFMWVYPTAAGVILDHSGQDNPYTGYRLTMMDYTSSGKFEVGLYNSGATWLTSTWTTPLNNWYNVGLTYDGSIMRGYINGQEFDSKTVTNWTTAASDYFHIGAAQNGTCFSVGCSDTNASTFRMGEFSIYTTTLSPQNVSANYLATQTRFSPSTTSPGNASILVNRRATFSSSCSGATSNNGGTACAYQWQLSTDSGANWTDISGAVSGSYTTPAFGSAVSGYQYRVRTYDPGSGSPSTAQLFSYSSSAAVTISTPPGSDTDTALTFNGSNQYAEVADTTGSPFDMTGSLTMEAWVYATSDCASDQAIISKLNSYMMYCGGGYLKYVFDADGAAWGGSLSTIKLPKNEWHHIAYTKISTSANALIYLDANLVATVAAGPTAMVPNNDAFSIGRYSGGNYFQGQIDEVRLYNSQRTQSQIAADMKSYGPINDSDLAAYYDFNEGLGTTLYNRTSGASSGSDLTLYNSPSWSDIKISDTSTLSAYTIVKFPRSYLTSNGGWKVPSGVTNISALIVAGGGGGGWNSGGGGGGGGYLYLPTTSVSGTVTIKVGAGGVGALSTDAGATPSYAPGNGQSSIFISTTVAGGNAGGVYGVSSAGGVSVTTVTGSSGAGGSGPSSGVAAFGGKAGYQSAITGLNSIYSAGGGGGGFASAGGAPGGASDGAQGGATSSPTAPGNGGGNTTANTGNNAATNTGSGGGASATHVFSGHGGSGVIIVRWITAAKPIFTQPTIDTTTAGLSDTITVSADPISPLTRNYLWQSSTDTGTTWSNISVGIGSGISSQTYTTPTLETTTSGSRYQYRVVVTDSDTAGLSITDTSSAIYIVVNPRISISGAYTTMKYGVGHTDTFTVAALTGTGSKTFTYSPNNRSGITWNSPSTNIATLAIAPTLKPGTFYETITATDSKGAVTTFGISIVVNKADTITVTALTASDTYTGSALAFPESYTVTGLVNSDTVTAISWSYSGTQNGLGSYGPIATKPVNAGSYTMTPSPTILNSDSYTAVVINSAPVTINRASRTLAISGVPASLKFGSQFTPVVTPSAGASDGSISLAATTPDTCTVVTLNILASKSTGRCLFSATISRGANYETATSSSGSVTLAKADTITVTVNAITPVTYSGYSAAITPTVTVSGLVNSNSAAASPVTYTYLSQPTPSGTCATGGTCVVGDIGPGGGYIFYVASSQQSWGTYLEAAPANWSGTTDDASGNIAKWCIATTSVDGTIFGTLPNGIGQGYANTYNTALNSCTGGAIYKARNYRGAGLSDWYLPTGAELALMATPSNRTMLGLVDNAAKWGYWGSNEDSVTGNIGSLVTSTWTIGWTTKSESTHNYLRPIRAFSPITATPTSYSAPPIDADTYTVQASALTLSSGSLSDYRGVTYVDGSLRINRALQNSLQIAQYGAIFGSPYKLIIVGGSGTGALTETVSAGSALGCSISGDTVTSTSVGTCFVTATKARDKNYETATASLYIYFLSFILDQPAPAAGSGATIALTGATSISIDPNAAPNISSLSTYTATAGVTEIKINGGFFDHNNPGAITVEFWRGINPATFTVSGSDDQITVIVPVDARTGKVVVITPNGTAVSAQTLTVAP